MKLALDFDSTLANTSSTAFDLICGEDHDYSMEDIEDWTWGFREFGKEAYLNGMWHSWTLRPDEVPPLEEGLSTTVGRLMEEFEVHIVTAHPDHLGITEGKRRWLGNHSIPHDEFVVVDTTADKTELDYDVFVDDKPTLPEMASPDQKVYLRDQRYNRNSEGDYIRVSSVGEVIEHETDNKVTV